MEVRAMHISLPKTAPMCTFLKNRIRFASHPMRMTCTKNLAHVTNCLRKWCITTYTDVCTTVIVLFSAPAACFAVDLICLCRPAGPSALERNRPALPTEEACTIVHIFSPYLSVNA